MHDSFSARNVLKEIVLGMGSQWMSSNTKKIRAS